jgi:group I intron endonuclease
MDYEDSYLNNKYFIYCYKNKINGKMYIGKTNNISKRKSSHRRRAFKENRIGPFYNALRKYGEYNFEFMVLDSFWLESIIFDLETFYINAYQSNKKKFGYNITNGGEGSSGTTHNQNQILSNRLKFGENNGNCKLNDNVAIKIFNHYKSGNFTIKQISEIYSLSKITVERLLSGKSWKHLKLDIKSLEDIKNNNIRKAIRRTRNE